MANLNDLFNLPITSEETSESSNAPAVVVNPKSDMEEDFEKTRQNLLDIAEMAQDSLTDVVRVAKAMQESKMYDSLSKMLTAAVLANKALMENHKNRQDVVAPVPTTVNNTLVLTTEQMQQKLEELRQLRDNT